MSGFERFETRGCPAYPMLNMRLGGAEAIEIIIQITQTQV